MLNISNLLQGIARLIEGQMRFADEFGLHYGRVFPDIHELLKNQDLEKVLKDLLDADKSADFSQQLFDALVNHQLALMIALDDVALQTVKIIEQKLQSRCGWWCRIKSCLRLNALQKSSVDFNNNQQARYHELVVPAIVGAYMRVREQR